MGGFAPSELHTSNVIGGEDIFFFAIGRGIEFSVATRTQNSVPVQGGTTSRTRYPEGPGASTVTGPFSPLAIVNCWCQG
jgi:hypothetical protein